MLSTKSFHRGKYRVRYSLGIHGNTTRKERKFARDEVKGKKDDKTAVDFQKYIEPVIAASREGQASNENISSWVGLGYLTWDEAKKLFSNTGGFIVITDTDFEALELRAEKHCRKTSGNDGAFANKWLYGQKAIEYLKENCHDLNDIKPLDVEDWVDSLEETYAPKSVHYIHNIMCQMFDWAVKLEMAHENPFRDIKLAKAAITKKERRPIEDDEMSRILQACAHHPRVKTQMGGGMRLVILLGFFCGLRNGEIRTLTWKDMDLKKGLIHIQKKILLPSGKMWMAKNRDDRTVGMSKKLITELEAWKHIHEQDGPYVFGGETHYTKNRIVKIWNRYLREAADLPDDLTFYSFRHRFAIDQIEAGNNLQQIRLEMGHRNLSTIENYLHDKKKKINLNLDKKLPDFGEGEDEAGTAVAV